MGFDLLLFPPKDFLRLLPPPPTLPSQELVPEACWKAGLDGEVEVEEEAIPPLLCWKKTYWQAISS